MSAPVLLALLLAGSGPIVAEGVVTSSAANASAQVRCNVTGAKSFVPAMTATAICARFSAQVRGAIATGESLAVDLRFSPNGVATAIVTISRGTTVQPQRDFNLAVSDRRFVAADIDRLAASVVTGLRRNH